MHTAIGRALPLNNIRDELLSMPAEAPPRPPAQRSLVLGRAAGG